MNLKSNTRTLVACLVITASLTTSFGQETVNRYRNHEGTVSGTAVSYPWVFEGGTRGARELARATADEILRKAEYATIPEQVAHDSWTNNRFAEPTMNEMPSRATLNAFGKALHADKVLFGSISWHTRSIWVTAGPKTISTATVKAFVYDVATDTIEFREKAITGRSDERESVYKIAADIIISPLVTFVSGGPATPQEQRAAQIALGIAFHPWVRGERR